MLVNVTSWHRQSCRHMRTMASWKGELILIWDMRTSDCSQFIWRPIDDPVFSSVLGDGALELGAWFWKDYDPEWTSLTRGKVSVEQKREENNVIWKKEEKRKKTGQGGKKLHKGTKNEGANRAFHLKRGWAGWESFSKFLLLHAYLMYNVSIQGVQALTLRMNASQILYHIFKMTGPHTPKVHAFKTPNTINRIPHIFLNSNLNEHWNFGWLVLGQHRSPSTPKLKP